MGNTLAQSRNRYPSHFERPPSVMATSGIPAWVDIQEPLFIQPGETKVVEFRYRSGVPRSTAFGITWHATEADADAGLNQLQDEPLPSFTILPQAPRADTGSAQAGTVTLVAPETMRSGIIWGSMAIYQP